MLKLRRITAGLAIVTGALLMQGCWDDGPGRLTLLGEGGCRTEDGGDGAPTYFSRMTLDECKAKCFAGDKPCTAIEFNANKGSCEVHSQPITKFEAVEGVECFVAK